MNSILIVSSMLFTLGVFGILVRRSLLFILLSLEIMLNAAAFAFVGISTLQGNPEGQVMFLWIAAVAAAEIGIGLSLIIAYNRVFKTIDLG
ncbi:MAG: NADH-quinone oxidoreductase subunit NuoK [Myxococcaceae bacterium]|nr:NADH-quinone oxidoreductase subunit NuoK [Myxococcaceae bacterium]MBH2006444.1 NADH-quinone oxidoreductase subunit NuoK [Myxococcaceae bacterium]